MKRFFPFGLAFAGTVLAFATLVVLRAGRPAVKRPGPSWRQALGEVVDEVSDKIEEALE